MILSSIFTFKYALMPGYNLAATIIWSVLFGFILAWYCGAETGLYRLNPLRLHFACKSGNSQALLLENLMKNQQGLIATFLIGTNLFSYFITGFVTSHFIHHGCSEIRSEILATLILTPILFVYTEAVPKNCFYAQANTLMLKSTKFIYISFWILKTIRLISVFNLLSRYLLKFASKFGNTSIETENWNNLSSLIKESFTSHALSQLQISLAEKIIELPKRKLVELIIPIWQMFALPADISRETFLEKLRQNQYSFVPIYKKNKHEIIGIVNSYQILIDTSNRAPAEFLRQIPKIRADERILIAFEIMKSHDAPIAQIVNHKNKTIGIVTLNDIIENILKY